MAERSRRGIRSLVCRDPRVRSHRSVFEVEGCGRCPAEVSERPGEGGSGRLDVRRGVCRHGDRCIRICRRIAV